MRLNLLGPLELVAGNRLVVTGGPRQRVILSMLGLNANRVTPIDALIDAVWDTVPPTTARGQIQTCVSALRRLFADAGSPDAIRTYPAGYLLRAAESDLDVAEFTELTAAARTMADERRTAAAAATLRSALGLWRGPALAGVDSRPVRRQAELLEHSRLAAVEERMRLELDLGWHAQVVGELAALVDEHPLREGFCELLMLALYRSGRQADALAAYRRAHVRLVEELAIEPGPELRAIERAILTRDPALDPRAPVTAVPLSTPDIAEPPMVPHLLPWGAPDFTGREDLVTAISGLLAEPAHRAQSYTVPVIVVSGPGGVGKSSLAVRVAHEVADQFPDGVCYARFQDSEGRDSAGMVLVRFLRALGISGTAVPEDPQQRADLYRTVVAGRRLLVVLDDVTSEEQVLPLLPGGGGSAVVVTSRSRLGGLPGATQVEVGVLDTDVAMRLLAGIVGTRRVWAEPDAAVELVRFCGGLPLALRIAGARLASRPHWRIAELVARLRVEARRLDEFAHRGLELRSNIGLTHRALSPRAQLLFSLLALVEAPDFPGWTAAALLDTGLVEAQDLLESLVEARMIEVVTYPGERTWYRFHDLVRVYAREKAALLDPEVRDAALRRVLGAWLALAEEVHRKEYGGDYTVLRGRAPRWRPQHGDEALASEDPVDRWDSQRTALVAAVRQAAEAGLDEVCWDLALTSVTLFEVKGYFDQWRETAEVGLRATAAAGNRVGQAAMLYSLGTLHMFQKRLDEAEESFLDALARFDAEGHVHGRALVLRNLALVDGLRGDWQAMLARYGVALELMRAVGDRMGEAQILRGLARFRVDEGDRDLAMALLREALDICREVGCLRGEAQVLNQFAYLHAADGRVEQAKDAAHRVLLIVRDLGDRVGEVHALYGLGLVRMGEGDLDSAETAMRHALSLARRFGERFVEAQAHYALGEIEVGRGDRAAAVEHLEQALVSFTGLSSALWRAKTLVLLARARAAGRERARAADDLRAAGALLAGARSKEADRLAAEIERLSSARFPTTPDIPRPRAGREISA
ncbi:AfsR/SARP family transcriptional regulator [Actinokineospora sp. 24-640]